MNKFMLKVLPLMLVFIVVVAFSSFGASPKYNWKLASVLPESHPVHKALVFLLTKLVKKLKVK